jgi:hypothetical protein
MARRSLGIKMRRDANHVARSRVAPRNTTRRRFVVCGAGSALRRTAGRIQLECVKLATAAHAKYHAFASDELRSGVLKSKVRCSWYAISHKARGDGRTGQALKRVPE